MNTRVQRSCAQPHGTVARYQAGCSCFECCDEWRRYQAEWKADGPRLVDAAPALDHIKALRYNGWRTRGIAEQSGVPYATIRAYRQGFYRDGAPVTRIHRDNAAAILSLPLQTPIPTDSTALVCARSTHRLIQRLRKHFTLEEIARECGVSRKSLPRPGQRSVQARTAKRIREAADRLKATVPR